MFQKTHPLLSWPFPSFINNSYENPPKSWLINGKCRNNRSHLFLTWFLCLFCLLVPFFHVPDLSIIISDLNFHLGYTEKFYSLHERTYIFFYPLDSEEWLFYHFLLQQKRIALFLSFSLHSLQHFCVVCLLLPTFLPILHHIWHPFMLRYPRFPFYLHATHCKLLNCSACCSPGTLHWGCIWVLVLIFLSVWPNICF